VLPRDDRSCSFLIGEREHNVKIFLWAAAAAIVASYLTSWVDEARVGIYKALADLAKLQHSIVVDDLKQCRSSPPDSSGTGT
jgi:hypothetical protein